MTIQEAKNFGKNKLNGISSSPLLDCDVLLMHITGMDKTKLLFERDKNLNETEKNLYISLIEKRSTGIAVSYLTNHKEFFGLDFFVTQDVLIPKPDTELLVELLIQNLSEMSKKRDAITICDMCTGSGCVGISILSYISENKIFPVENIPKCTFVDISEKALGVCKQNAKTLLKESKSKMQFLQSNLFGAVPAKFNVIVSNPPYIPQAEAKKLLLDGRGEPLLALNGDIDLNGRESNSNDGLQIIRNLTRQAYSHLNPRGMFFIEAGEDNALKATEIFAKNGFIDIKVHNDLAKKPRVIEGRKP